MTAIITQALTLYFTHYFDFSSYTNRKHYWWALGTVYVISMILGMTTGLIGIPWLAALWLAVNIIPLLSLTCRRMRDVGFTNRGLVTIFLTIILCAGLVVSLNSRMAAFVLQLLILLCVLSPLLDSDELTTNHPSNLFNYFVRIKQA